MDEPRFLPYLAAACSSLLGEEDPRNIPPPTRAAVANKAGVGEPTVERFLRAERVPRNHDLEKMVNAVAVVAGADWLDPWEGAAARAKKAKVEWERYLSGEIPIAKAPTEEPGGERSQRRRQ